MPVVADVTAAHDCCVPLQARERHRAATATTRIDPANARGARFAVRECHGFDAAVGRLWSAPK